MTECGIATDVGKGNRQCDPSAHCRGPGMAKYTHGLKHLIPVRWTHSSKDRLPLESLGFFNYLTFGWLTPHLWGVYRKGVEVVAGLDITHTESAQVNARRMQRCWDEEVGSKGLEKASFAHAIFKSFKTRFLIGSLINLIGTVLTMAIPIFIIHHFLQYLSTGDVTLRGGLHYIVLLAVFLVLRGLCGSFCWMVHTEAATRIKSGSHALVYKKILRLKSLKDKSIGDMVNLFSLDGQCLWDGVTNSPMLVGGAVGLLISCGYSVHLLGLWALLAWVVVIGFYPCAGSLAKRSMSYRTQSIRIADQRVGLLSELLTSMTFIKMNAWEKPFCEKITDLRKQERRILEKSVFTMSTSMGLAMLVPLFASCVTFIGYVGSGNNLTAKQAFTFVALLNTMQISLATIPFALKSLSDMFVSSWRIKELLLMEEMGPANSVMSSPDIVLEMKNVSVTSVKSLQAPTKPTKDKSSKRNRKKNKKNLSGDEEKLTLEEGVAGGSIFTGPVLKDITVTLERGQLIGVCGQVGCGKSTLLNAILGRMHVSSGSVSMSSSVAYTSQNAWVTGDTIRQNIVLGSDFDEERYKQVIGVCALQPDLDSMPLQDLTQVGERGVTLSGGQKQRVALARAAYSQSDLVLLDDPLASVDVHVGRHVFDRCIKGWLRGRSTVLVTHQTKYLKNCDQILVLQDGQIVERGTHHELLRNGGVYVSLLNIYGDESVSPQGLDVKSDTPSIEDSVTEKDQRSRQVPDVVVVGTDTSGNGGTLYGGKDLLDDDLNRGQEFHTAKEKELVESSLQSSALAGYIGAMGGFVVMAMVFVCFAVPVAGITGANWFLSYWINQAGGDTNMTVNNVTVPSDRLSDHPNKGCYLTIYSSFLPTILAAMVIRALVTAKAGLSASTSIHNKGLTHLLTQPLSYFLSTPAGRIINRFSTDLDEIDSRLPMHLEIFLMNVLQVFAALGIIAYVSPWFLLAMAPIGALFWLLVSVFHSCFHRLKSLDNITRSPVVSHLTASVQGLHSIHAFGKTKQFFKKYCDLLDSNSVAVFLYYSTNRWLALRLDIISALVIFFAGLLILTNFDLLTPALAGLGLSYAIQISGLFQFTVRLAMESEARFTSVQRLQEYCHMDAKDGKGKECMTPSGMTSGVPSEDWPHHGQVTFTKVTLCYKHGVTPSLRNVTFEVKAGEKVGIVGRTGAGKSSLCSALLRLFDLDQGQISIDGLDITKVDCDVLRSRLSVIPQNPVLLAGTIRYNLDPVKQHTDDALWEALRQCHAGELVKSFEHQLDTHVEENGDNFSIGEKQLLCMARVFLKKSRILVLDEATASMDTETHTTIQATLQHAFTACTMLVVSHRLDALTTYDKVMVLEDGRLIEYDSPSKLLSNPQSKFAAMLRASADGGET